MMVVLFTLMLFVVLFVIKGDKKSAYILFTVAFICTLFWFYHHVSDAIGLSL